MFNRKIFVFRLRFSLRPVHWRIGQHPTRAECGSEEPVDQTSWPGSQQGHWKTTQTIFDMICHENYPIEQIMLFFFLWKNMRTNCCFPFDGLPEKRQQFEASMPSNGSHQVADLHSHFQTRWVPTAQAILDEVHLLHWLSGFVCSEIQRIAKSLGIPAGTAPGFLLLVFLLSARFSKTKHDFARKNSSFSRSFLYFRYVFHWSSSISMDSPWFSWVFLDFHMGFPLIFPSFFPLIFDAKETWWCCR